jgi:cytochrome P450
MLTTSLPTPRRWRRHRNRKTLDAVVYDLIADQRARGSSGRNLLATLLAQQDATDGLTDRQLRDEVMTLILAGHETTANALAWTFYLLSQNPEAERRLHLELAAVLGDRPPTFEDLPRLTYARQVFSESLRLYPPAWVMVRTALANDHIGGYVIPRGASALMSPYVMHRHPAYWDEPGKFRPERFAPESGVDQPRYVYFPFGGGPRLCIGESFAWMEGTLMIAALAREWRFQLAPDAVVEPEPSITLRPRYGLPMVLHTNAA